MENLANGKRASDVHPPSPQKRRRTRFAAAPCEAPNGETPVRTEVEGQPCSAPEPGKTMADASEGGDGFRLNVSSKALTSVMELSAIPVAPVSTLKINQQVARREKIKRDLKVVEADLLEMDPTLNSYFDPEIKIDARTRRPARKSFSFVNPHDITTKAEKDRRRAEMRTADAVFRDIMAARAAEIGSLPPLPPLSEGTLDSKRGGASVPQVEWWDAPFINLSSLVGPDVDIEDGKKSNLETSGYPRFEVREDRITHYIHHPVRVASSNAEKSMPVMPLLLTEKERKRLRRQRRVEKETERREMVAVGLIPAPPPKVKLSNLMRVLANEASADPTRVEADVCAQVEERQRKHIADNEARRKTKPELREKAELHAKADRENGLHANVYRIISVENAQHRYKIDVNAHQLQLTGVLIEYPECNVVIVEGGAKALRKYQSLMLRRIDWTSTSKIADARPLAHISNPNRPNKCTLIWEGPIASPAFDGFKSVKLPTENSVKSFLRRRHVESYFALALSWCEDAQ
jgi:U4/U6 small nuclear ribonucleoprotein PRP3